MKITLGQLRPNPFRDLARYPIHREKVEALKASIRATAFWDNVLVRRHPKEWTAANPVYEVAYGHHRIEALKELQREDLIDADFYMNLPVRELDDARMIQIMANENVSEFAVSSDIIDDTISAARAYISRTTKTGLTDITASDVAQFLGGAWNEDKVQISLQRLSLFDRGTITREQLKGLSHTAAKAIQREVAAVEKTMVRDQIEQIENKNEEVSEADRKAARARVKLVANHVAGALAEHVRSGGTLGEIKVKSLDAQIEHIPDEARDGQKLATIDAASRSVSGKEFQRKVELLMQYRAFMSEDAQKELREKLLELADWGAQMAEQLES